MGLYSRTLDAIIVLLFLEDSRPNVLDPSCMIEFRIRIRPSYSDIIVALPSLSFVTVPSI